MERRVVTHDNVDALISLKVRGDQENLVAPNAVTLAQAAYEPGSHVWGIFDGSKPVGLIAMIHPHHGKLVEGEDPDAAYLWRLLVSADIQGRGVGRFAISECIAQAREWGLPRLASSVVDAKNSNMGFYERVGFHQTGIMVDGERQILMDV